MAKEFSHMEQEEQLKAENDFMKMKLMLEKGAEFKAAGEEEINPEIENQFLKNVLEFEKQFEQHKTIKVVDKIGRPDRFKPSAEIPDNEIEDAWKDLSAHLYDHGISLGVCSPNVSTRELYRFTVEELFLLEMDDVNVPGMIHGFIYDEFYPDIAYDNTRVATEDCIAYILRRDPLEWMYHFKEDNLRLNEHHPLNVEELKHIVNQFKNAYEDMDLEDITDASCTLDGKNCVVTGKYHLTLKTGIETWQLSGKWEVAFELNELDYWYITNIQIENISF